MQRFCARDARKRDENEAFRFVEGIIWPQGPVCFHCGAMEKITSVKTNPEKRVRYGLKRCAHCKGQFTVRMGTIFEESKLPLTKWLQAIFLMCATKKGVSAHQLGLSLEVTYKTAWFLAHRIREAIRTGASFGQGGGDVESDETYIGRDPLQPLSRGWNHKVKIVILIDRNTGAARSHHVEFVNIVTITKIASANITK